MKKAKKPKRETLFDGVARLLEEPNGLWDLIAEYGCQDVVDAIYLMANESEEEEEEVKEA